jgi:aerobic carbon-monoxide dehydrogenase medium subunit
VKVGTFDHHVPRTVNEAMELMAEHGGQARPLAGGQSLVPLMAFRLAGPSVLVHLDMLGDLVRIGSSDRQVIVGAMVRERAASVPQKPRRAFRCWPGPCRWSALPTCRSPTGKISVEGDPDTAIALADVAAAVEAGRFASGTDNGREVFGAFDRAWGGWAAGTHCAEVEVDPDTERSKSSATS